MVPYSIGMRINLREHLGVDWKQELVSYPVSFSDGAMRDATVGVQGPDGVTAGQLRDIAYWPGSSAVKSATLWFVVDKLAALTEQSYTLVPGAAVETDLQVVTGTEMVDISTSRTGLRCLLGSGDYADPVSADKVPGPVVGMRLPDGNWFGGSRLYGTRKVCGWAAELIANGPVVAEVAFRYLYADGLVMRLNARICAGDSHVHWSMSVAGDALQDGWRLKLTPGLANFVLDQIPWEFHHNTWGAKEQQAIDVRLDDHAPGELTRLVPWEDWWDDQTQTRWVIRTEGRGKTLEIASEDPDCWVEPAPKGTLATWEGWLRKPIGLCRNEGGEVYLRINAASGRRAWRLGAFMDDSRESIPSFGVAGRSVGCAPRPAIGMLLNEVKGYALAWPGDAATHPRLYLTGEEVRESRLRRSAEAREVAALLERSREESHGAPHVADADALGAYLLTGSAEVAAASRVAERLRNHLALFGAFDTMRFVPHVAALYDALIDGPLIGEEERAMLRARFAYLGYVQGSSARWSCERGYRSYNLNMSVSHTLHLGMIACTIPEHPQAGCWVQPAIDLVDDLLGEVGPAGEWPESVSNYVHVTGSALLLFAITARQAGFRDFVDDPRMKRLFAFMAKQYAPRDLHPREAGAASLRGLPPHGRAKAGHRNGLPGLMARATLQSDPTYSAEQQWVWKQLGENREIPNTSLCGFEQLYLDAELPSRVPDWRSEAFPQAGVILRGNLGTPHEFYANLISADFPHQVFPSETGAISLICAKGAPLAGAFFGGYGEREELLASRVCLARGVGSDAERRARVGYTGTPITPEEESTGRRVAKPPARFGEGAGIGTVSDFSWLPRQDYASIDVALVHPQGAQWPVAAGLPEWPPSAGQGEAPLQWRRQVLFLKDPRGATDYLLIRDTVRGDQPTMWQMWSLSENLETPSDLPKARPAGQRILPCRRLRQEDRFTARGQFGVEMEYFIASPKETPRHTLRWGTTYTAERCSWHSLSVLRDNYAEYRDLLHLQLPGDGAYYVAFYPRRPEEEAPRFSSQGGGTIIKVSGSFGTDHGFLSALPTSAEGDGIRFQGVAGSVQERANGLVLALGAAGRISHPDGIELASAGAAQLHLTPQPIVQVPCNERGREVTVRLPGQGSAVTLSLPPGVTTMPVDSR